MVYRYYRGEKANPYAQPDGVHTGDPRAKYWWIEREFSLYHGPDWDYTQGFASFPCQAWRDFLRQAEANLQERALAFNMEYEDGKWGGGAQCSDWYSYFSPRVRWQAVPFDLPADTFVQAHYRFEDCDDAWGYRSGKRVLFGPIVQAVYRGTADYDFEKDVPVFELENLRGDSLFVATPLWDFRRGMFRVVGEHRNASGETCDVYVYDRRLHVALARLACDDAAPAVCVGERLDLPAADEVAREMKWYGLSDLTNKDQRLDPAC